MNRERRFGRLGRTCYDALVDATALCQARQSQFVELEHWMYCIWQRERSDLRRLVDLLDIDALAFERRLKQSMERLPRGRGGIHDLSGTVEAAMASALGWSQLSARSSHVRSGHLLLAGMEDEAIRRWLERMAPELAGKTLAELAQAFEEHARGWTESHDVSVDGQTAPSVDGSPPANEDASSGGGLQQWAVSLSAQAQRGELDPVVGRDAELRQVLDILLRRRQNNPLLVGEAGVGKTAVAEALAQRIHDEAVPPALLGAQVWALDLSRMQAGASARGEFEQRMRSVLDAIAASAQPVILFCDEVHTLVGAGGAAGTGDAANLIKPMLARGQLRMVAATTWSEYKQYIESDAALTRRFQAVTIDEPDDDTALAMLRVIAGRFAQHHGVHVADSALQAAVKLSRRHLPGRQLPDKAISLLDTACARVAMSQSSRPALLDEVDQELLVVNQALSWRDSDARLGLTVEADESLGERSGQLAQELARMTDRLEGQRETVRELLEQMAQSGRIDAKSKSGTAVLEMLNASDAQLWVRPWVDSQVIASVLSEWTGVPSEHLATSDADRILALEATLNARIHGQAGALRQIVDSLQAARAGLNDSARPLGVFALAGPTGTGKTEAAVALADLLFGGSEYLIHFNMNEFQEAHSVSTLKGAPPGYVGYGKGGRLTEAVRRRPYSVVLLDEFDQAHRDVHEVFYQVFDKGWMEDGEGRRVSFRNCLILLTTNLGTSEIEEAFQEGGDVDARRLGGIAHQAMARRLAPALLARMQVAAFRPLDANAMAGIADRAIAELKGRLAEGGVELGVTSDVREWVARIALKHPARGRAARDLLQQTAVPVIAKGLLDARSRGQALRKIRLSAKDGLAVEFDSEESSESLQIEVPIEGAAASEAGSAESAAAVDAR